MRPSVLGRHTAWPAGRGGKASRTYGGRRRGRLGCGLRVALELAAGCVDIQAARLANEAGNGAPDDVLEGGNALRERRSVGYSRAGIQRDQIDFGVQVGEKLD